MTLKRLCNIQKKPKTLLLAAFFLMMVGVLVHLYTLFNVPVARMLRGVVLIEDNRQAYVQLDDDKIEPIDQPVRSFTTGFFVDASGVVQTRWRHPHLLIDRLDPDSLRLLLQMQLDSAVRRQEELVQLTDEMNYYHRTHTIVDEGYNQVMELGVRLQHESDSVSHKVEVLQTALAGEIKAVVKHSLHVYYRPTEADSLQCFDAVEEGENRLRLSIGAVPEGAYVFNTTSLRWFGADRWALGYLHEPQNSSDSSAFLPQWVVLDEVADSVPLPASLTGAPIVDSRAHLRAICTSEGYVPFGGFRIAPRAWWKSVRQWLSGIFTSDESYGTTPVRLVYERLPLGEGTFTGVKGNGELLHGRLDYSDGTYYIGLMSQAGKRVGKGELVTADGQTFEGEWEADTLPSGVRVNANGRYEGGFDAQLRPQGNGVLCGASYYEGEWNEGLRHGFGIALIPGRITSIGVWKNDRFLGERIVYNDQRVYGIDISRYQHDIKGRMLPIHWKSLRIVNLGKKSRKVIDGAQDYPVSFCYIKATQGVTIESKYSDDDAFLGRRAGVHVGHYHFFSPMSGVEQAKWFLQKADMQRGDLPPMLDVELTDKQIESMGGIDALLREMVEWIKVVESRVHTKPVLYLNQSFVDKYFEQAPEDLKACPVWIARYSEFRPYVRLVFWQLSADGVVKGVTGNVDIDVFNGSQDQFEDFVKGNCIK